jgi:hypothetical protein
LKTGGLRLLLLNNCVMKTITLGEITLTLFQEGSDVRIVSESGKLVLSEQTIEAVSSILEEIFVTVKMYYDSRSTSNPAVEFQSRDIEQVSLSIVLEYLYMYNSWRRMYKKQENISLRFRQEDFNKPSTHDVLFSYYREKYPKTWEEKCAVLLAMNIEELCSYYKSREAYYNK